MLLRPPEASSGGGPLGSGPYRRGLGDFYDRQHLAGDIGVTVLRRHQRAATLVQRFAPRPRRRLLDIGCGSGGVALYLKESAGFDEVYGVDVSSHAVAQAKERGVSATVANTDEAPLPYGDGFFEAVLCSEVIEHMVNTDGLLEEVHRTLAPGGLAVLTTPNLASLANRMGLLLGWQPFTYDVSLKYKVGRPAFGSMDTSGHLHMFTYRALRELLPLHSFQVLSLGGLSLLAERPIAPASEGEGPGPAMRVLLGMDWLASLVPSLAFGVIAAVRKPQAHRQDPLGPASKDIA